MENRSNLKGLKPGFPDKEPRNTFPPSSNIITGYKHCDKRETQKALEKHKHIHRHQAELTRGCLWFWLPLLLSSILQESLVRGKKKQESYCKITALLYPKLEVWLLVLLFMKAARKSSSAGKMQFYIFLSPKANRQQITDSRTPRADLILQHG